MGKNSKGKKRKADIITVDNNSTNQEQEVINQEQEVINLEQIFSAEELKKIKKINGHVSLLEFLSKKYNYLINDLEFTKNEIYQMACKKSSNKTFTALFEDDQYIILKDVYGFTHQQIVSMASYDSGHVNLNLGIKAMTYIPISYKELIMDYLKYKPVREKLSNTLDIIMQIDTSSNDAQKQIEEEIAKLLQNYPIRKQVRDINSISKKKISTNQEVQNLELIFSAEKLEIINKKPGGPWLLKFLKENYNYLINELKFSKEEIYQIACKKNASKTFNELFVEDKYTIFKDTYGFTHEQIVSMASYSAGYVNLNLAIKAMKYIPTYKELIMEYLRSPEVRAKLSNTLDIIAQIDTSSNDAQKQIQDEIGKLSFPKKKDRTDPNSDVIEEGEEDIAKAKNSKKRKEDHNLDTSKKTKKAKKTSTESNITLDPNTTNQEVLSPEQIFSDTTNQEVLSPEQIFSAEELIQIRKYEGHLGLLDFICRNYNNLTNDLKFTKNQIYEMAARATAAKTFRILFEAGNYHILKEYGFTNLDIVYMVCVSKGNQNINLAIKAIPFISDKELILHYLRKPSIRKNFIEVIEKITKIDVNSEDSQTQIRDELSKLINKSTKEDKEEQPTSIDLEQLLSEPLLPDNVFSTEELEQIQTELFNAIQPDLFKQTQNDHSEGIAQLSTEQIFSPDEILPENAFSIEELEQIQPELFNTVQTDHSEGTEQLSPEQIFTPKEIEKLKKKYNGSNLLDFICNSYHYLTNNLSLTKDQIYRMANQKGATITFNLLFTNKAYEQLVALGFTCPQIVAFSSYESAFENIELAIRIAPYITDKNIDIIVNQLKSPTVRSTLKAALNLIDSLDKNNPNAPELIHNFISSLPKRISKKNKNKCKIDQTQTMSNNLIPESELDFPSTFQSLQEEDEISSTTITSIPEQEIENPSMNFIEYDDKPTNEQPASIYHSPFLMFNSHNNQSDAMEVDEKDVVAWLESQPNLN